MSEISVKVKNTFIHAEIVSERSDTSSSSSTETAADVVERTGGRATDAASCPPRLERRTFCVSVGDEAVASSCRRGTWQQGQLDRQLPTVHVASLAANGTRGNSAETTTSKSGPKTNIMQAAQVKQGLSPGYVDGNRCSIQEQKASQQKLATRKLSLIQIDIHGCDMIFDFVRNHIEIMNGINLATAVHRVARCYLTMDNNPRQKVRCNPVLAAMLNAIENMAVAGSLPQNCSSIITWSCATMGLFRTSLFLVSGRLARDRLFSFKPYEITNILWAFAQFAQQMQSPTEGLANEMRQFFNLAVGRLQKRSFGEFKVVSLASALVTLDMLSGCAVTIADLSKVGFHIADELLKRAAEWPFKQKEMVAAAKVMRSMGLDADFEIKLACKPDMPVVRIQ